MVDTQVACRISKRNIVGGTEQSKSGLRVTVENHSVVTSDQMAEDICFNSTLTPSDVQAVIVSLKQQFINALSMGKTVSLDGIGTFSLSIGTAHPMYDGEKVKAKDICLKGITFRPTKSLIEGLEGIHFVPHQDISAPLDGEEALNALRAYMADESHGQMITIARLATLCHCCYTTSKQRIHAFCDTGILQPSPYVRHCYIPGSNF